jgi:Protein of unknown function (DUF3616)
MPRYRCGPIRTHEGVRDASGAVAYRSGTSLFLVASDEDKERTKLRLYDAGQDGKPVREFDLSQDFLAADPKHAELDLEAAACTGKRIFWIGSHSRSKDGEYRSSRHRLFATELKKGIPTPIGRPYRTLLQDLGLDIDAPVPPKEGGVSIEGLASSPVPGELMIGFRSPLIDGKALIVTLRNADEVVQPGIEPEFGTPTLLDLGGLGIRSIDYWPERDTYILIAGPVSKGSDEFRLYRWRGSKLEDLQFDFSGIESGVSPEGLLIEPASETVYVFFDEGNRKSSGDFFRSISVHGL